MRVFISDFFKFILFTAFFYILSITLAGSFLPHAYRPNLIATKMGFGESGQRLGDVKRSQAVDVLVVGNSHAYRGFDPRIFQKKGKSMFNLGSNSQTFLQTEALIDMYLDSLMPELVIIEVSPLAFSLDGVESAIDILANDEFSMNYMKMALKINHLKVYNSAIFSSVSTTFNINDNINLSKGNKADLYVGGGYVEIDSVAMRRPIENWDSYKVEILPKQLNAFEKILSQLKSKNIKYVLVQAPIAPAVFESCENNTYYDSLMTSYGDYYNFNKIVELPDTTYFYDYHHLTQTGVEKFNQKLVDIFLE